MTMETPIAGLPPVIIPAGGAAAAGGATPDQRRPGLAVRSRAGRPRGGVAMAGRTMKLSNGLGASGVSHQKGENL